MKSKVKPTTVFFIIAAGVVLSYGLFYVVDIVRSGSFEEWFMKKCMMGYAMYSEDGECVVQGVGPVWANVRELLLTVCINLVVIWLISTIAVSHVYAKIKVKKAAEAASKMFQEYMTENEEAARKSDLITYLAHDLKTSLTSVIGYLSLLDEAADMPVEQKAKYVNIALDKAKQLEKLINEFFEITRYNLQQIDLEEETIDLYYMLVQMTDEFYPLLHVHGNTTNLRIDEDMTIYGDPAKLARVFNNILKNAIAYSYRDTVIEIWAESTEKEVLLYFCNKGKTIPAQKLNSVFEKFFRLDEARTTNTGGAGLGLAIAKEIVALHGGTITARSEDELTTFCVSLPRREMERIT